MAMFICLHSGTFNKHRTLWLCCIVLTGMYRCTSSAIQLYLPVRLTKYIHSGLCKLPNVLRLTSNELRLTGPLVRHDVYFTHMCKLHNDVP